MRAIYYASKYYSSVDVLEDWLTRFSRMNTVAIESCCVAIGMTASEVSVLGMLSRADSPLSPTRLQVLVIQSPGGLTKTLRRLEDAGFVRRRPDAADRRALLVELSASGRRAATRAAALVRGHYTRLLDGLTESDRLVLTDLTRRLIDQLEANSSAKG